MRIKVVPFGIAFGVVYAAVFFLCGILAASPRGVSFRPGG